MATPTINAARSSAAGGLLAAAHPAAKSSGYDGASAFQGFLQKSAQTEKPTAVKNGKSPQVEVPNKEGNVQAQPKKPEVKSEMKSEGKTEEKPAAGKGAAKEVQVPADKAEAAGQKLKAFAEEVRETLGLSEEDLQHWLNTLGLGIMDLLNPAVLQNFFMQVKGIDVSQLLTEPEAAAGLKGLLAEAGKLQPEMVKLTENETQKEEFARFLQGVLPVEEQEQVKPAGETNAESKQAIRLEETIGPKQASEVPKQENKSFLKEENAESRQALPEVFSKVVMTEERVIVTAEGLERVTTTVSAKDVFQQVVTKFTAEKMGDAAKLTVQLNPEHLGKVAFQVVSRQGQLTGQFVAESEAVKTALEAQVSQLKTHLAEQGIRVADVKVVVGDTVNYFAGDKPKEQNQEAAKKKSRRFSGSIAAAESTESEEAPTAKEIGPVTGMVDFTA